MDIKTLLYINLIINCINLGAMVFIWRQYRRIFSGISFFLANMLLHVVGISFVLLRGVLPDFIVIVIANALLLTGALCILMGLECFVDRRKKQIHNLILLMVYVLLASYFFSFKPDIIVRTILISIMIVLLYSQSFWLLVRRAPAEMSSITRVVAWVLGGYVLASVIRIVLLLALPREYNDFFTSGIADSVAITVYLSLHICFMISLSLMITRRLLYEVQIRQEILEKMANHDHLTGLPMLRLFEDRVEMAINGAKPAGQRIAVMFIDLDGFKTVNDTYGHVAGDYVLKEVAKRLERNVRNTDMVARIGGDEFMILISPVDEAKSAGRVAVKIIDAIGMPIGYKNESLTVGASIGISFFPDHGANLDTLRKIADKAMYSAKKSGKNRFAFAPDLLRQDTGTVMEFTTVE